MSTIIHGDPRSSTFITSGILQTMPRWVDPVKNQPPKESTMSTRGNFREFTDLMRKIVNKQEENPKSVSSSRVPDAS